MSFLMTISKLLLFLIGHVVVELWTERMQEIMRYVLYKRQVAFVVMTNQLLYQRKINYYFFPCPGPGPKSGLVQKVSIA